MSIADRGEWKGKAKSSMTRAWDSRSKRRSAVNYNFGVLGEGWGRLHRAEKGCPLRPSSHGSLGPIKAKVYGETQYVKNINRATHLKVEWGSGVLYLLSSLSHPQSRRDSEKPQSFKNKNNFYTRIFKSHCNTSFVLYWVSFPEKHLFLKLLLDEILLKCVTFLPS